MKMAFFLLLPAPLLHKCLRPHHRHCFLLFQPCVCFLYSAHNSRNDWNWTDTGRVAHFSTQGAVDELPQNNASTSTTTNVVARGKQHRILEEDVAPWTLEHVQHALVHRRCFLRFAKKMSERLLEKRTTVAAVAKRLHEIIPYMDDADCDAFLVHSKQLNIRCKKNKERMEAVTTAVPTKTLDELLEGAPLPKEQASVVKQAKAAPAPPTVLRASKSKTKRDREETGDVQVEVEEGEIVPWDLVAHNFIKEVRRQEGDDLIVWAKRSSHGKVKCFLARLKPEQISLVEKRHWLLLAEFYRMNPPMPEAVAATQFGQYVASMPRAE